MLALELNPHTFYSVDLVLGLISTLVAVFIAGYALKGYWLTKNKTSIFFSSAFMLIAAGLLSRVAFDYLVKFELSYNPQFLLLETMTSLQSLMLFFSIFLLTTGYVLLLVLFYRIKSKRVAALIISLIAILVLTTSNAYLTAHLVPGILLLFGLTHTIDNFLRKKNKNTFLVLASFAMLLLSELVFLLVLKSLVFYFAASILRVIAYLLLLANTVLVLKR
ncbi:hypothetical protein HYU18_02555 [Candidatus Woesearchaeota archaeon]|nr:hypothetical protein [Candidatus Woesearchaeota archaeon]